MRSELIGKTIYMRPVVMADAAEIVRLRSADRCFGRLTPTSPDVALQEAWLEKYFMRFQQGQEIYFASCMISNDAVVGFVRLQDVTEDSVRFGSWVSDVHAPAAASVELVLLFYHLVFLVFGKSKIYLEVQHGNHSSLKFHPKLGAKVIETNEKEYRFQMDRTAFLAARGRYHRFFSQLMKETPLIPERTMTNEEMVAWLNADSPTPKVSFLVLCHQHAPFLKECLSGLEAQQWPNAEVIVLDNASNDGSAEILKEWAEQTPLEVTLLLEETRRGVCANANRLLSFATGEYIALIAGDDYWLPQKTRMQVNALSQPGQDAWLVYADALRIDADGKTLEPASFINAHRTFETLPSGDVFDELLRGPFIPAMSTLVRRKAFEEIGEYDETLIYEDYDCWLRMAARGKFLAMAEPVCAYRILTSSMIHTVAAQDRPDKILSDARIMAKVSAFPRMTTKARENTLRRVSRLTGQLLQHPGSWKSGLRELHEKTGLPVLAKFLEVYADGVPLKPSQVDSILQNKAERPSAPAPKKRPWWKFY
jgi:GT2 family glycosyltransferase/RimJ/RimL family protein N-acetyltransferase